MNVEEGDQTVGLRVAERDRRFGRAPIVIQDRLSVESGLRINQRADLVLGMRLHAVIFGIALGRPTVAQAYAGKVAGFMEWLGLTEDALPLTASSEQTARGLRAAACRGDAAACAVGPGTGASPDLGSFRGDCVANRRRIFACPPGSGLMGVREARRGTARAIRCKPGRKVASDEVLEMPDVGRDSGRSAGYAGPAERAGAPSPGR